MEIYAGDTWLYTEDIEFANSKVEREEKAAEILKEEFPEFVEMYEAIKGYERRVDPESKFVYALDKILPDLNIYLDKGRSWRYHKIKREMIVTKKQNKIALSEEVKKYWDELHKILKEEEQELFPKAD